MAFGVVVAGGGKMKKLLLALCLIFSGCACQHHKYTPNEIRPYENGFNVSLNCWGQFRAQKQWLGKSHQIERTMFWCDECNKPCASSEDIREVISIHVKKTIEAPVLDLDSSTPQRVDEKTGVKSRPVSPTEEEEEEEDDAKDK